MSRSPPHAVSARPDSDEISDRVRGRKLSPAWTRNRVRMRAVRTLKLVLLWLMAVFYVVGGYNHFANPEFYLQIMPPYLPWHLALVYISGVAEIALGIAVVIPRLRPLAAWGIVALLVAVFPANLHQALADVHMVGQEEGLGVTRWVRLPLQGVLIAWAWWYTRPDSPRGEVSA